jgi:hypothetical protein
MKIIAIALSLMPGLVCVLDAQARDDQSVQALYDMCQDSGLNEVLCLGYIAAAGEVLQVNGQHWQRYMVEDSSHHRAKADALFQVTLCGKPTLGAMHQAFLHWVEKNPEQWDQPRILGLSRALHETWVCKAE